MNSHLAALVLSLALLVSIGSGPSAEEAPKLPANLFESLPARNIGPANMGGRICDLAVVESDPRTMYVGVATGGLWKTTDAGDNWTPVFDQQTTLNIGAVAIAPSNPEVVYVGTGEANARNSVSWGEGVYRSTDGGKTWKHLGLKETHHIGRVVVHPKNPEVAFVAALGHLWGPNPERGIYKTSDGGKTWEKALYIDAETGFIDVAIDPREPDILYASTYCVRRDAFAGGNPRTQWGPNTGLFRTDDGGKTWKKMTEGLPDRPLGRCGFSIYRKEPNIVYAVIQTDRTAVTVQGQTPREGTDVEKGGIFRSEDRGKTWKKLNDLCPRPFYYGQIRVDPEDDKRIYVLGVSFFVSSDGGKTFTSSGGGGGGGGGGAHPDHHALWINPRDNKHLVLGNDGGLYVSNDRTKSWQALRGMAIGQFYGVAVDMHKPYRVYGGLQDNGSWGGPTATESSLGITVNDWKRIGGGDGFQCAVDPKDSDTVYYESQYGNLQRLNLKATGRGRSIRPRSTDAAITPRFNWNSPILVSPHDSQIIFYGGNVVFRSTNRGDKWDIISPDLTRKPGRNDYNGHTITTLAESPVEGGVLWAGTDDGKVHVTRNDGKNWKDVSEKIPGVPADRWITRIECSHFDKGLAYLTIDRHRNDDRKPYLFKTTDYGDTWVSVVGNLPGHAPLNVVRESSKNRDLLFAGTEFGLFCTLDGGKTWQHLTNGLPLAVTVHDLVIHPRDRELVIGTHARSVYVMDIAPLEEMTPKALVAGMYLFDVKPALARKVRAEDPPANNRSFRAPNPPVGATIYYHLKQASDKPVSITISDAKGKQLAQLTGPKEAGVQKVQWNLKPDGDAKEMVEPGEYNATFECGGQMVVKKLRVEKPE
jgi:photosystem II stability/assembly factor-like uncharacterized protein